MNMLLFPHDSICSNRFPSVMGIRPVGSAAAATVRCGSPRCSRWCRYARWPIRRGSAAIGALRHHACRGAGRSVRAQQGREDATRRNGCRSTLNPIAAALAPISLRLTLGARAKELVEQAQPHSEKWRRLQSVAVYGARQDYIALESADVVWLHAFLSYDFVFFAKRPISLFPQ